MYLSSSAISFIFKLIPYFCPYSTHASSECSAQNCIFSLDLSNPNIISAFRDIPCNRHTIGPVGGSGAETGDPDTPGKSQVL